MIKGRSRSSETQNSTLLLQRKVYLASSVRQCRFFFSLIVPENVCLLNCLLFHWKDIFNKPFLDKMQAVKQFHSNCVRLRCCTSQHRGKLTRFRWHNRLACMLFARTWVRDPFFWPVELHFAVTWLKLALTWQVISFITPSLQLLFEDLLTGCCEFAKT